MELPTFEKYCQLVRQKAAIEAEIAILEKQISFGIHPPNNKKKEVTSEQKHFQRERQLEIEEKLLAQPEVFEIAGVASWKTLSDHIDSDYFPSFDRIISKTRHWLFEDIQMWQAWKEAKKETRRTYRKWLGSNESEYFSEFAKRHGFPPPSK